ncbi:helix-turn-helix domain-containing protein [Thermaurantiacus sp.]
MRGLISSYYLFAFDRPFIADVLRAELPQIRFLLEGSGRIAYGGEDFVAMPFASLAGPSVMAIRFEARGPFRLLGVGLLPAGWSALIGESADRMTDRLTDLEGLAPAGVRRAFLQMHEARSERQLIAAADAFFLLLSMNALPPPLWFTRTTDAWLSDNPNPDVNALIAELGMSARQVERLMLRHYGSRPKLLARKYRTLQAAVRLGLNPNSGWQAAAGGAFYDQSHFIRDFKLFVGMTPGQFVAKGSPWLTRLTIAKRTGSAAMPKITRVS